MGRQEKYDYSIKELLEEAKNDPSWEPDEKNREDLTAELYEVLNRG